MTEETEIQRLYSKPPPGYTADGQWWSFPSQSSHPLPNVAMVAPNNGAMAAAWAHYKASNDPPGLDVNAWGFGQRGIEAAWWRPLSDDAALASARAAAWVWYDRRLALAERIDQHVENGKSECRRALAGKRDLQPADETSVRLGLEGGAQQHLNMFAIWPDCLTWSDDQVAEVERWLADSTVEMPEVLRG